MNSGKLIKRGVIMNRRFRYNVLTGICFMLVLGICFIQNHNTRYLISGSTVPNDLNEHSYVILDLEDDSENQLMTFQVEGVDKKAHLALIINDMGSFVLNLEASLNGQVIYEYDETARFQRTNLINIPAGSADKDGVIRVTFSAHGWQSRSQEIVSRKMNAAPKLILCTYENAMRMRQISEGIMYMLIGMYLITIVASLCMFVGRPKEYGYMFLMILCLLRFITTAIDSSIIIHLTMRTYYQIRHVLVVLPVAFYAAVGVWLLRPNSAHKRNRNYIIGTIALTAIGMALQQLSTYNWYHLFQLCAALTVWLAGERASAESRHGWWVVSLGYTAGYAIVSFIYLVTIWNVDKPGVGLICINFTNLSYLPGLLADMIFISIQLVKKFNETEALTERLAENNRELDRRVEEKTAQLIAAQTARQHIMLNIFHDLRNPVFVLRGCLDNIHPLDEAQSGYIQTMYARLGLLQKLIDELFLAEKLDNGAIQLYCDDIRIDELVKEVSRGLQATGRQHIITQMTPVTVWGDETRLIQVVQNLSENAYTYTDESGTICFEVWQEKDLAFIRITDTGIGMSDEECQHIFERYFTGSRSQKSSSSGLGLYIASELVHLHGGTISVSSKRNEGTAFTVALPVLGKQESVPS